MRKLSHRRGFAAGLTTAVLAGGAVAAGAATPATAATAAVHLQTPTTVALPAGATTVQPSWSWSTGANQLGAVDVTVTVDVSGLSKVAKVQFADNCTVSGLTAVCDDLLYFDDTQSPSVTDENADFTLSALPGAKLGANGSYTVTGTSTQATVVGGTGRVTVGGPSVQLVEPPKQLNKAVGSKINEAVTFSNTGNRPADGIKVGLALSPGLTFAVHHSNCRYRSHVQGGHTYDDAAVCSLPGRLLPGAKVTLAQPVRLTVGKQALYTYLDEQAAPAGDTARLSWITAPRTGETWRQGTGTAVGLKTLVAGKKTTAPAGTVQLDNENQGYGIADVTAVNHADFGVTGATATAAAGTQVTMGFTLFNHGPATLFDRSGGEATPIVVVTPPPGTTVVGHTGNCSPRDSDDPAQVAHGPYYCDAASYLIPSGSSYPFSLTLNVDTVTPAAKGSVVLAYGNNADQVPPYDSNPADNSAVLQLN